MTRHSHRGTPWLWLASPSTNSLLTMMSCRIGQCTRISINTNVQGSTTMSSSKPNEQDGETRILRDSKSTHHDRNE